MSGLWRSAAAAGSVYELSGLRLGRLRLAGPVPASRLVGLSADGLGAETLADQPQIVLQQLARVWCRVDVVAPDNALAVAPVENCEDVQVTFGHFVQQVRPVGQTFGEGGWCP